MTILVAKMSRSTFLKSIKSAVQAAQNSKGETDTMQPQRGTKRKPCFSMINCSIIRNHKTSGHGHCNSCNAFFAVLKGVGPVSQSTDCDRTPSEPQSVVSGGMSIQLPLQS
eukprot:s1346_g3.t1